MRSPPASRDPVMAMLHHSRPAQHAETAGVIQASHSPRKASSPPERAGCCNRWPTHMTLCYHRWADASSQRQPPTAASLPRLANLGLPRTPSAYLCGPAGFMIDVTRTRRPRHRREPRTHVLFGALARSIRSRRRHAATPAPPTGEPGTGPFITSPAWPGLSNVTKLRFRARTRRKHVMYPPSGHPPGPGGCHTA